MNTLTELGERVIEVEKQREQYKAECDTLIDDIAVLKANISRLERENERLLNQSNFYARHNELAEERLKQLLPKEHNYVVLTSHIRTKAENNPGVSRYIDLVNYIDRLEQK